MSPRVHLHTLNFLLSLLSTYALFIDCKLDLYKYSTPTYCLDGERAASTEQFSQDHPRHYQLPSSTKNKMSTSDSADTRTLKHPNAKDTCTRIQLLFSTSEEARNLLSAHEWQLHKNINLPDPLGSKALEDKEQPNSCRQNHNNNNSRSRQYHQLHFRTNQPSPKDTKTSLERQNHCTGRRRYIRNIKHHRWQLPPSTNIPHQLSKGRPFHQLEWHPPKNLELQRRKPQQNQIRSWSSFNNRSFNNRNLSSSSNMEYQHTNGKLQSCQAQDFVNDQVSFLNLTSLVRAQTLIVLHITYKFTTHLQCMMLRI
ncbi:hypothetical protein M758_UG203200 [Ceratodon purpureus]|nr:hypothetical protein M758_UG203200 [Ceratodon purpureus]